MVVKIKKKYFLMHFHFDPAASVYVFSNCAQDTTLCQLFFSTLYLFDSIFSDIVWTNTASVIGCMILTVAVKISKKHFFNDQCKMLQEEKQLFKNMNLTDANYHLKNWVDWILDTWWDKTLQLQKCTFWEKEPKK